MVYLPAPFRYPKQAGYSAAKRRVLDTTHSNVLELARTLRIPVIDTVGSFPDAPEAQENNKTKFFYPYFAHYRPEGYRAIGQAILNGLPAASATR
jgi:hypothetical protein